MSIIWEWAEIGYCCWWWCYCCFNRPYDCIIDTLIDTDKLIFRGIPTSIHPPLFAASISGRVPLRFEIWDQWIVALTLLYNPIHKSCGTKWFCHIVQVNCWIKCRRQNQWYGWNRKKNTNPMQRISTHLIIENATMDRMARARGIEFNQTYHW